MVSVPMMGSMARSGYNTSSSEFGGPVQQCAVQSFGVAEMGSDFSGAMTRQMSGGAEMGQEFGDVMPQQMSGGTDMSSEFGGAMFHQMSGGPEMPQAQVGYMIGSPGVMGSYVAARFDPADIRFEYTPEKIVLAAGQYREIRPVSTPGLLSTGCSFLVEPPTLPQGLQFDPSSGAIWGTPAPPPPGTDPAGPYSQYTIFLRSSAGLATAKVAIKVVHFDPSNFRITHVSQLEPSKYMVLVDMRQDQQEQQLEQQHFQQHQHERQQP